METPCTKVCKLHANVCVGCGRTKLQIKNWKIFSPHERAYIMEKLNVRVTN